VLRVARAWGVRRVTLASTIGVYAGVHERALREDPPLPMTAPVSIPAAKKCGEIIASLADGFEVANMRIGASWGPQGAPRSPFFALPALVNAAVDGRHETARADDGIDALYVKDCGRAIALLQTAPTLNHTTYNVGTGRSITNREVAAAIGRVLPGAQIALTDGGNEQAYLDVTRLRQDTGFEPAYDLDRGIADYAEWLRRP
jgi:UDP-glucose 4-epimerase